MIRKNYILYSYIVLVLLYFGIIFLTPPAAATLHRYHLTATTLRLLDVTIALPLAFIWYMALYGYARLKSYSQLIKTSKDGRQIVKITQGLMVLALGLPLSAVISAILKYIADNHAQLTGLSSVISNYVNLLFPLIAFVIISGGTRGLSELVKARPTARATHALILGFVVIGVGYCYFVLAAVRTPSLAHTDNTVYHLPVWAVLLTLVVPYLYMWFIGLFSAYQIYLYNHKVAGVLYRRSWTLLAAGVGSVILTSIVLQYLTSLSDRLNRLSLGAVLLVVYILLLLLALSYGVVALGAKKLQQIEEI